VYSALYVLGAVAQLGERGLCKPEVVGSNPISSTKSSYQVGGSFFTEFAPDTKYRVVRDRSEDREIHDPKAL
jgi:hypothetical protein